MRFFKRTISYDEYIELSTDALDKHFPKGKTKMRGEAMVLIADILTELMQKGVVEK